MPVVGVVHVGVYLQSRLVTELEDPTLLNPAAGTPSYQEPGAARYVVDPVWGVAGDGKAGDFYPVWTVENGFVRAKEAPPNIDAVSRALQQYDIDSTGGSYVVQGLEGSHGRRPGQRRAGVHRHRGPRPRGRCRHRAAVVAPPGVRHRPRPADD